MVGLSALWMPIVVSAVFVFIALALIHGLIGWHKGDMTAVPGEAKAMETLRGLNVQPGTYRFPFSTSVDEMKTPAWACGTARVNAGIAIAAEKRSLRSKERIDMVFPPCAGEKAKATLSNPACLLRT